MFWLLYFLCCANKRKKSSQSRPGLRTAPNRKNTMRRRTLEEMEQPFLELITFYYETYYHSYSQSRASVMADVEFLLKCREEVLLKKFETMKSNSKNEGDSMQLEIFIKVIMSTRERYSATMNQWRKDKFKSKKELNEI